MTQADLPTLLEKLRATTGGEREIDIVLTKMYRPDIAEYAERKWEEYQALLVLEPAMEQRRNSMYLDAWFGAHRYTASIDSVVALIEAEMPGACWSVTNAGIQPRAIVFMPSPISRGSIPNRHQSAPTPALALLCAFVEAIGEKT